MYSLNKASLFSGIGIHSGIENQVQVFPGSPETGIRFFRDSVIIPCDATYAISASRATVLEKDGMRVRTPEHLLSALVGLGIVCADIHLSAEEVPILDGSAQPYVSAFLPQRVSITLTPDRVLEPVAACGSGGATVSVFPDTCRRFTYLLHYDHPVVGYQSYSVVLEGSRYETEIANARTFGFLAEIEALKQRGLALGGSLDNAVVIGDTKHLNPLRFPDELARHKLLDLIGDMALVGKPFLGHVIAVASGHALHAEAARKIQNQLSKK